jgi:hypothetical protein
MNEQKKIDLKKVFEVDFIAKSFFQVLVKDAKYSKLLIQENNDFFTLSNENLYIVLFLKTNNEIIEIVDEKLKYIFNRTILLTSLKETEIESKFGKIINIKGKDIISKAVENGISKNSLYLIKLNEIIK